MDSRRRTFRTAIQDAVTQSFALLSLADKHERDADADQKNAEPSLGGHALVEKKSTAERSRSVAECRRWEYEANFGK